MFGKDDCQGTIVFVEQKRQADFIAAFLSELNYPTTSIHGDRQQPEREQALRDFKTKKMKVLVATAVAARGLGILNLYYITAVLKLWYAKGQMMVERNIKNKYSILISLKICYLIHFLF